MRLIETSVVSIRNDVFTNRIEITFLHLKLKERKKKQLARCIVKKKKKERNISDIASSLRTSTTKWEVPNNIYIHVREGVNEKVERGSRGGGDMLADWRIIPFGLSSHLLPRRRVLVSCADPNAFYTCGESHAFSMSDKVVENGIYYYFFPFLLFSCIRLEII